MNQSQVENNTIVDEISVKDLINNIKSIFAHLKNKWLVILAFAVVGAFTGIGYSLIRKTVYTAVCTFVLDEGNGNNGLSQYNGLASIAGIDIGGSGGGIFQGDNILELYKSRLMIEKTLLSEANFDGRKQLLIDRYIDFNKLRDAWKANERTNDISFYDNPNKFNRTQDSIVNNFVEEFNNKILSITKVDKKLNIISVQVTTTDELFSKEFANALVENVNEFYVQTKTKKTLQNVLVLQRQVDSIRQVLNSSINGVASSIDATPNPTLLTLRVPSQRKQVDVQANTSIYAEIVKNLEVSKMSLRQETPLIQIIDKPVLPLVKDHLGKSKSMILGFFLGSILIITCLILKRMYNKVME